MNSVSLDQLNTLAVPSTAQSLQRINSSSELMALAASSQSEDVLVLGGGSNVVLGERIERPIWLMRNRGVEISDTGTAVEVKVAAGECWHDLVRWTLGNGLSGLENLALIPGSVGAAPVQNIGAYGVELNSCLVRLEALDRQSAQLLTLGVDECEFGYRQSLFKAQSGRFVISTVTLSLHRGNAELETSYADLNVELDRMGKSRPDSIDVAEAVVRIRRRKLPDPRFVPNVGSFFKNPLVSREIYQQLQDAHGELAGYPVEEGVKLAAAQLIDRCGFKRSMTAGAVQLWPRQALVLTNPGHATASEILARAADIQRTVERQFDVRLEIEPDIIECRPATSE